MSTRPPYSPNFPDTSGRLNESGLQQVAGVSSGQPDPSSLTYEINFGLHEKPFSLSADPRFFFHEASHGATFDALAAGLRRREGIMVLTGEAGTGKTILCRAVLRLSDQTTRAAFIPDPCLSREDLLKTLLVEFGVVSVDDIRHNRLRGVSRTDLSYQLYDFLTQLQPRQGFAVVVIEEAQNLPTELLTEIRVLSDLENRQKLLQVVLVGKPELQERLRAPGMRELSQRVSISCELRPLTQKEIEPYVLHRLTIAGNDGSLRFTDEAISLVAAVSSGIPRLTNLVCDRALFRAAHAHTMMVDARRVREAIDDLKWPMPAFAATLETGQVKRPSAKPEMQGAGSRGDALEVQANQEPEAKPVVQTQPRVRPKLDTQTNPQTPVAVPAPDPSGTRAARARRQVSLEHQRLDFPDAGFDLNTVDDLSSPSPDFDSSDPLWQNHPVATHHRRASQQRDDVPPRRTRTMTTKSADPTGAAARTHLSNRTPPSNENWDDHLTHEQDPEVSELVEQSKPGRGRLGLLGLVIFLLVVATVMIGFQSRFFGGLLQSPRDAQSLVPVVPEATALTATTRD